jgi:hypothetical protein
MELFPSYYSPTAPAKGRKLSTFENYKNSTFENYTTARHSMLATPGALA